MKKGFTLIEIIIAISLIVLIGIGSFIGIRFVNDKIKVSRLEQITDKAIEAAQVYIETNKESYNQLYSNQNGVSLPLRLLYDKGLLNIDNTDLTVDDLDDEYVVTFLGGSGGSENCEQITSTASWGNDKEIYLCMNSSGDSNLKILNPEDTSNKDKITKERFYYKGTDPLNYIKLKNKDILYRILYVDTDDSITLYYKDSFSGAFNISQISYIRKGIRPDKGSKFASSIEFTCTNGITAIVGKPYYSNDTVNAETCIGVEDVLNTVDCKERESSTWLTYQTISSFDNYVDWSRECSIINYGGTYYSHCGGNGGYYEGTPEGYKIHLNSCMKITSGTGDIANPYILEPKNCPN